MLRKLGNACVGRQKILPAWLKGVVTSTIFDLDATVSTSYPGSGTSWKNLANPADGEAKTTYDFTNENAATLFTGTAGDNGAYFNMAGDSTNLFSIAANTNFTKALHKTTSGEDFWIVVAGKATGTSSGQVMVGTQGDNSSSLGVSANYSSSEKFILQQYGTSQVQVDHAGTYANTDDFLAIFTHSHSTNKTRIWVNGYVTELDHTFDTTTSDPASVLHIGGHLAGAFLPSGFRLYSVAMGNEYLTAAQEALIRGHLEARHGRDYTDNSVDAFAFTDVTDQELSTQVTSDIIEIKGFADTAAISISGGDYRICADDACSVVDTDWTSSAGTIESGQYVQVRVTTSSENSTAATATLTVGDQSDEFSATTEAAVAASLADVEASTVFHLDATKSESYSGSGTTWANLVASPADGSAQGAYNFTFNGGLSFSGTAGDAAAYITTDGSGYAEIASGANTTFTAGLHKTTGGSDWWFAVALQIPDDATADGLFGTTANTTSQGLRAYIWSDLRFFSWQRGDSSNSFSNATATAPEATDVILIVSHSHSTNETSYWVGSATGEAISRTFNTTTTDATAPISLFRDRASGFFMQNGARVYAMAMGNAYLDNTKAGAIITELESQHSRDYTNN